MDIHLERCMQHARWTALARHTAGTGRSSHSRAVPSAGFQCVPRHRCLIALVYEGTQTDAPGRQSGVQHPACCSCARPVACLSKAPELSCLLKRFRSAFVLLMPGEDPLHVGPGIDARVALLKKAGAYPCYPGQRQPERHPFPDARSAGE